MKIHIIGASGSGKTYLAKNWQASMDYQSIRLMICYIITQMILEGYTMKTKPEDKMLAYRYLEILKEGYEKGDFSKLFPFLAKDCIYESQWVFTANRGYEEVVDYFMRKGTAIQMSQAFPMCSIQELVGNMHPIKNAKVHVNGDTAQDATVGLYYQAGELCLLMEQTLENETFQAILRIQINDDGRIKRIDMCMPELFQYRLYQHD